jgi:hypothetical protein
MKINGRKKEAEESEDIVPSALPTKRQRESMSLVDIVVVFFLTNSVSTMTAPGRVRLMPPDQVQEPGWRRRRWGRRSFFTEDSVQAVKE